MNVAQANQKAFEFANTDPKVRAMRQAGFSDDQIKAAMFGESAKAAEIERRAGNQFVNPLLGASGIVPKIPENANPVGPVAPNGALPGGVQQMPGTLPVVQGNAQAGSTGSANGSIINVTLPNGAQVPARGGSVVGGGMPQPAPQPVPQGGPGMPPQAAPLRRPSLGQSTQDRITQEANAKEFQALPVQVQQSKQTIAGLENAYRTIEQLDKSGKGVGKGVDAMAVLNNLGIPVMKGDVNGYQTLKKFLENSASTAAASNGFTGSDALFEQFKAGQPNAETMNPDALKGAIRYVLSQHDAAVARADFIQKFAAASNDPNALQQAQQAWSQNYSPKVFEFSRMTPPERQQFKASLSPQQRAAFGQQYNTAHNQGWVQ
jgi:hypothetical protein